MELNENVVLSQDDIRKRLAENSARLLKEKEEAEEAKRLEAEEIRSLYAELKEEATKRLEMEMPSLEQMLEDSRKSYSEVNMFDYPLSKMSNMQAIGDFYGWGIVRQIEEDIAYSYQHKMDDPKPGQISKKLWQKMKDIRAGKLPKEEPHYENKSAPISEKTLEHKKKPAIEINQRVRQKGDDYFLILERGVIRNESYRKLFKGPGIVYEWLWANIIRDQWKDSKAYPIKEKYHDRGYLAYCSTYGKIARDCGMSKNTVHAYIKNFEEAGIIKTRPFVPIGKKEGQTVFILGTWRSVNGEREESYYRDKIFLTPKLVKN